MIVQVHNTAHTGFVKVELEGITDEQYKLISDALIAGLEREKKAFIAVAKAMMTATQLCPQANPADLWVHLIYREFRERAGRSDQSWKRVSGQAFENVIVLTYAPRLLEHQIVLRVARTIDAVKLGLQARGMGNFKTDLILEGIYGIQTYIFGAVHCKSSIAERLTDDAPASEYLIKEGLWSGVATLDSKMFPPPHGDAIVRGELGAKNGDKRNYFEIAGQFSGCYSFNKRTPPSKDTTQSGIKIYSLTFQEAQPDILIADILNAWKRFQKEKLS